MLLLEASAYMNRRFQFAIVASSTCVVALLLFGAVHGSSAATDNPYNHLGVYSEVLARIKADYVEEPDMKAVTLGAINGMLESIDPYASYLNSDQYKQYLKAKETPKADVGVVISKRMGYVGVVDVVPGSAAAKAGLTTGDVIESIANVSTRDMPLAFAEILLQGDPGSSVEVSILRVRRAEPQKITMVRATVVYPAVSGHLVTDQGPDPIGVIQTSTLGPGRVKEVAAKIAELEKQGAKRLILDLRHCSTGSPEEGIALANLFLDKGLIAYSQGQKVSRQDYQATASKEVTKLPLVVITNRGTADAAEVATAALLDSKRAEVVGERTYGDAAIRKAVTLDDGSAVILSVAKFYSPSGKSIQDTGVTPSVVQAEIEPVEAVDDDGVPEVQDVPTVKPGVDELMIKALKISKELNTVHEK
jgi:carboxyl-terminal processing protease